jgi:hypothetical protein
VAEATGASIVYSLTHCTHALSEISKFLAKRYAWQPGWLAMLDYASLLRTGSSLPGSGATRWQFMPNAVLRRSFGALNGPTTYQSDKPRSPSSSDKV